MDNIDFKLNEKKKDIYFSNETESKKSAPVSGQKASPKKPVKRKKSKGVASTYLFFIIVIACSMLLSIYAIFCMNDILAITKTTSLLYLLLRKLKTATRL